jgi:thiol:disulfide interchange protein DsbC
MNLLVKSIVLASSALLVAQSACAKMNDVELEFYERVNIMLKPNNVSAYNVSESIIPDFFEVDLSDGKTILVNNDGTRGIVSGRGDVQVYDFKNGRNMTRQRKAGLALEYVNTNKPLVSYKAKEEIGEIYVFADIQCGYCQKLHESIPEINNSGITVSYYPIPNFENSDLYMNAAYCSSDPEAKYTELTEGLVNISINARQKIEMSGGNREDYNKEIQNGKSRVNAMSVNIINNSNCKTYDMENAAYSSKGFGITGTPNILFPNGIMVEGKMEISDILDTIKKDK